MIKPSSMSRTFKMVLGNNFEKSIEEPRNLTYSVSIKKDFLLHKRHLSVNLQILKCEVLHSSV